MISSTTPKLIYVYNLRLTLYSCLLFLEEGKYDSVACMLLCGAVRKSFPVHLAQLVFFVLIHGFIFSGLLPEKKKKKKTYTKLHLLTSLEVVIFLPGKI